MGNCQAAEAATVEIQHPGGRTERAYWSIIARNVMSENPGYYVAMVVTSGGGNAGPPVRHLKLLRPDDTLLVGNVYRLVSFEDVLKEFGSRKHMRLSRMLTRVRDPRGGGGGGYHRLAVERRQEEGEEEEGDGSGGSGDDEQRMVVRNGQWRPSLQRIEEIGG